MKKYLVKSPIKYGREIHGIDAIVEMDDKAAKRALDKGSVVAMAPIVSDAEVNTAIDKAATLFAIPGGSSAEQLATEIQARFAGTAIDHLATEIKRRAQAQLDQRAEQEQKEDGERKAKAEAEQRAKEEAERKAKEEAEQRAKEETERKVREATDKKGDSKKKH